MKTQNTRGFTLLEVLITTTLLGLLATAVMGFFVMNTKTSYITANEANTISTMRSLTNALIFTGSRSHECIIYPSSASSDRVEAKRQEVVVDETTGVETCPTGDFAVFVYYEVPKPSTETYHRIRKIVGYSLEPAARDDRQLVSITIDLSAAPSTDTVESILTAKWATAERKIVAERVVPLALSDGYTSATVPRLFYKRANQNLVVSGQIYQGGSTVNTADWRTRTRTFYFSVSIRS